MRKYQQLLLVVISLCSVIVLLVYKSENHRLKDVLQVVNIFGRNDSWISHQIEQKLHQHIIDLTLPLPVWSIIGDNFFVYASYWHRNELVAGGEAVALVSGRTETTVNFQCQLEYENGQISAGKFHFQRIEEVAAQTVDDNDANSAFVNYNFYCRSKREDGTPKFVMFKDSKSLHKLAHKQRLRQLKDYTVGNKFSPTHQQQQKLILCVDMVNFNSTSTFAKNSQYMLQFFLHHKILGVQHFVVYNSDEVTLTLRRMLQHLDITLHLLPFNFPFAGGNSIKEQQQRRTLLALDCQWRNAHFARNVMLLQPNEFFVPKTKLEDVNSVLRATEADKDQAKILEVTALSVCADTRKHLLLDNVYYDPELNYKRFIYRVPVTFPPSVAEATTALAISAAQVHKYTDCAHVGKDGLRDWRNGLREDFMQHFKLLREQTNNLLTNVMP